MLAIVMSGCSCPLSNHLIFTYQGEVGGEGAAEDRRGPDQESGKPKEKPGNQVTIYDKKVLSCKKNRKEYMVSGHTHT